MKKSSTINYGAKKKNRLLPFEMGLTAYYLLAGTALAIYCHDFSMWPYHLMLAFGFGMICYYSFQEQQMMKALYNKNEAVLLVA